jgi:hypothetical protein
MDEGVGGEGTDGGRDAAETREEGGRRRRRRGGRGRGRGRGREETAVAGDRPIPVDDGFEAEDEEADVPVEAPRPRSTPFGSVWDSQLGTPAARLGPIADDDDDFEEPEIPEYLIAERRQSAAGGRGGRGGARGPRGGRSAYQSAVERERYGRGGGGGINRYPDVSGRTPVRGPRDERGYNRADVRPREAMPRSSAEPWSEVPPELEAMLRAQVSQRPPARPTETSAGARPASERLEDIVGADGAAIADAAETAAPKRRSTRSTAAKTTRATSTTAAKPRATRRTAATAGAPSADQTAAAPTAEASGAVTAPAPKRTTTRRASTAKAATGDAADASAPAAPKRRTTRKAAATPAETD